MSQQKHRERWAALQYRLCAALVAVVLCSLATDQLSTGASAHVAAGSLPREVSWAVRTAASSRVIDFGQVAVGARTTRVLTLTNTSPVSAAGIKVTVSGAGYSLGADTCTSGGSGATVAAGAACAVHVTFAPTMRQAYRGVLTISSATVQTETATLTGIGVEPATTPASSSPTCDQPKGLVIIPYSSRTLGGTRSLPGGGTVLVRGLRTTRVTLEVMTRDGSKGAVTVPVVDGGPSVRVSLPFTPHQGAFVTLIVKPGAVCGAAEQKIPLYVRGS